MTLIRVVALESNEKLKITEGAVYLGTISNSETKLTIVNDENENICIANENTGYENDEIFMEKFTFEQD